MAEYIEIQELREINRLNKLLARELKQALGHKEIRAVVGNQKVEVQFRSRTGHNLFYWAGSQSGSTGFNVFGHGTPGDTAKLEIDVQCNVPIGSSSFAKGGAFLKHRSTGKAVFAHRGKSTLRGHGFPSTTLFTKTNATICEADTGKFLLVAHVDLPTIVRDIEKFSSEIRRVKEASRSSGQRPSAKRPDGKRPGRNSAPAAGDAYLRYVGAYEVRITPSHSTLQKRFERFLVTDKRLMAKRLALGACDQLHHFIAAGVWDTGPCGPGEPELA